MDYKVLLGLTAVVIGFIGYAPYIRNVLRGKTKPHAFSWLVWGLLETIAFFAQLVKGGGAGTWVTACSASITLFIAVFALRQKDKQIRPTDWIALTGALIGITLWQLSNDPLLAVISIVVADALAFAPTFRKSFRRPNEETLTEYFLSCIKWLLSIFALGSLSFTTWLYPASLAITNGAFVILCLIQRKRLSLNKG